MICEMTKGDHGARFMALKGFYREHQDLRIDSVIPADPESQSGAGAGIEKRPGFFHIKYGTGSIKPGMIPPAQLLFLCIARQVDKEDT
jgi:hypothetical protein